MAPIATADQFRTFVEEFWAFPGRQKPVAFALGLQRLAPDGITPLDTWFPIVNYAENFGSAAVFAQVVGHSHGSNSYVMSMDQAVLARDPLQPFLGEVKRNPDSHPNIDVLNDLTKIVRARNAETPSSCRMVVAFLGDQQDPPKDAADAAFRLHLLSHRKVLPNTINLDGVFGLMPNVHWTSEGPVLTKDMRKKRMAARLAGRELVVRSKDRFPRLVDYVDLDDVRIADGARVRLGAYLSPGTTVMHAGFVNFNAGTLGPCMVEGRISSRIVVGGDSDLGGGSSTLGTLSGGNDIVVSIGRFCLIEANCGLGIPIGDRVRIAARYVKSTNWVRLVGGSTAWSKNPIVMDALKHTKTVRGSKWVKAIHLMGISDAVFRRNDFDGRLEVLPRGNRGWGKLNPALHQN